MDEIEAATPYTIYFFDCPECGDRVEIGDQDPGETEECYSCGAAVPMSG